LSTYTCASPLNNWQI